MAYEQRDNSGTIFKNGKPKNEKSPQMTGTAKIDGAEYFFDAWQKQDKNGNTYYSCAFKKKEKQPEQWKSQQSNDFDDDIPF